MRITFSLSTAAAPTPAHDDGHRPSTGKRNRGRGLNLMRALVIDDSRAMRSILAGILGEIDCEVVQAADAEAAYALLEEDREFDFGLVDWNLPAMSGVELVRSLRALPDLAGIRLMMVTTETESDRVREALEAGADEYIMKPFNKEMLLEKLMLLGLVGQPE
jgi:two-component system chemotaxis response regulator CheY